MQSLKEIINKSVLVGDRAENYCIGHILGFSKHRIVSVVTFSSNTTFEQQTKLDGGRIKDSPFLIKTWEVVVFCYFLDSPFLTCKIMSHTT